MDPRSIHQRTAAPRKQHGLVPALCGLLRHGPHHQHRQADLPQHRHDRTGRARHAGEPYLPDPIDGVDRIHDSDLATAFDYFDCLQARLRVSVIYSGRGATDIVDEGLHNRRRSERPRASEQFRSSLPVMRISPIPLHAGQEGGWRSVLQRYDSNLRLYNHKPGTLLDLEEELHARTGGYMDTLDQLICQTAQEAIEDGTEAITKEALDNMIVGRNDSNED